MKVEKDKDNRQKNEMWMDVSVDRWESESNLVFLVSFKAVLTF